MNLGLFLAIGESFSDFASKGQLARLVDYNISKYSKSFNKVYIFSYQDEKINLPPNCILIPNKLKMHRYLYALMMPIINYKYIIDCNIIRGLQLTGGIPAVISKIIFSKNFVINYGYDYEKFAKIEGKNIQAFFYKIIQIPVLSMASAIIVTSKSLQNQLAAPKKVFLIPNGVDLALFKQKRANNNKKKLTLIFAGRLEKQKNLENLIIAVGKLKINAKLMIYGNGSLKSKLIKLARKNNMHLILSEPVTYTKLPAIFAKSDIFILPSVEEGNPKVLIEAMASGLAVVGTNVQGINEIITPGVNGLLCGTSPTDIAKEINKLKDYKKRRILGLNARKYVEKNNDINLLLTKETKLLKNISQ